MAISMNNHVFKGHKTLLGARYVTYGEVELPSRYDIYQKSKTFDWGFLGSASLQLSFAMLYQITKDKEISENLATDFSSEVIKYFGKDWIYSAKDVQEWLKSKDIKIAELEIKPANKTDIKVKNPNRTNKRGASKDNIVKQLCKEMGITQKELSKILEVPEGTVSSWAVKNEIPRLGKKAIEFYMENKKQEEIIKSYKEFVHLLQHTAS
jgi:DNA-binding transcriptional regulator YiaG